MEGLETDLEVYASKNLAIEAFKETVALLTAESLANTDLYGGAKGCTWPQYI